MSALGTVLLVGLILAVFLGPIVFLSWKGWRAWTNIADAIDEKLGLTQDPEEGDGDNH